MSSNQPNPVPGWYPQADGSQRYWDGGAWAPAMPPAPPVLAAGAGAEKQDSSGIALLGYILAILMPILGFILGIVALTRPNPATSKNGIPIILLSILFFFIWIAVLSSHS